MGAIKYTTATDEERTSYDRAVQSAMTVFLAQEGYDPEEPTATLIAGMQAAGFSEAQIERNAIGAVMAHRRAAGSEAHDPPPRHRGFGEVVRVTLLGGAATMMVLILVAALIWMRP